MQGNRVPKIENRQLCKIRTLVDKKNLNCQNPKSVNRLTLGAEIIQLIDGISKECSISNYSLDKEIITITVENW